MVELPPAITDYIAALPDEGLDRLLTARLVKYGNPLYRGGPIEWGCLMQVAEERKLGQPGDFSNPIWRTFDSLCGTYPYKRDAEVGAAIREYVYEVQARRRLAGVRELVGHQ